MAYPLAITNFAQSVYLVVKNRYLDDIADSDGQLFISQVVDWTNQLLDELETVTDASGKVVDWNWLRSMDESLDTATVGSNSIDLDDSILNVVANPDRPIRIEVGGKVISTWLVVAPGQISSNPSKNLVAKVGATLFFSRKFNDAEDGGTIIGDITSSITRMTSTISDVLTTVKPKQLLILGVAKNSVLPDIVQGGLTPSYVQKYNDLLQSSILTNNQSADSDYALRDDNSFIGGVY